MDAENNFKYYAFISYKREDEEWAKWLQHKLEHYRLPSNLNGRTDLPKEIRPIFRDQSDLAGGVLADEIDKALESSKHLIVICSPHSAQSEWVNKEIETFIRMDRTDKIIPFIIDGKAFAKDPAEECFPSSIRNLPAEQELLGANIGEMGRDAAAVKVIAQMFGLKFDELWQRHEREKKKRQHRIIAFSLLAVLVIAGIACWIQYQNTNIKKKEWTKKENQARFVAEKANDLIEEGNPFLAQRLLLEVLPKEANNPDDRPYVPEAEAVLRKATNYQTAILRGHTWPVNSATYSPDGKLIASASRDGTIRIWEVETGKEIKTLDIHFGELNSSFFSPDGKQIVSASTDDLIRIWDINSDFFPYSLNGHFDDVLSAVFSSDGKRIISVSRDNTIRIWDARTGEELRSIPWDAEHIIFVTFSLDGRNMISVSDDNTIRIVEAETGLEKEHMKWHTEQINFATFSPDGSSIITTSSDHIIRIWESKWRTELKTLKGHTDWVNAATFSPDGKHIASASNDETVRIWNIESGKEESILEGHDSYVHYATYSPDSKRIASAAWDGTVRIWDAETGEELKRIDMGQWRFQTATFSPDCKTILTTDQNIGAVSIWNIETGERINNEKKHYGNAAAFSPDGKRVVSADDGMIQIWDSDSSEDLHTIKEDHVSSIAFSSDGGRILTVLDTMIKIRDSNTGTALLSLKGHTHLITSAVFSPDGKQIISSAYDSTIRIWDAYTGKELKILRQVSPVNFASFSPDGKYIISASDDKTIRVWEPKTGKELDQLKGHCGAVSSALFSPDGKHIVSASDDKTVRIWNFTPLQELIDQTRERFKDRPLTDEERKMYYLE